MKIIIGGDISPINSNENHFNNNSRVFNDFQELFNESDLNIINLEVPLTNSSDKILKSGKNIKGPTFAAKSLKESRIDIVSLANNHMGDFSDEGVIDTINNCNINNLKFVGAGLNSTKAQEPIIFGDTIKVGILSFSDTEFGVVKKNKAGVNPLDICNLTLNLIELKKKVDFCIVLLHEGKEHYEYPSPDLQKICRYISDIGADLIVCQHSHISGAWEKYKQSNIFYGQGNLMFDFANRNSDSWTTGFLIQIELTKDKNVAIKQIPFKQTFPGIGKLNDLEEKEFYRKSNEMQKNVINEDFIVESWNTFITNYRKVYYSIFRGQNRVFRKINSIFSLSNMFYNRKKKAMLLNIIRSRVHREAIINILENDIK